MPTRWTLLAEPFHLKKKINSEEVVLFGFPDRENQHYNVVMGAPRSRVASVELRNQHIWKTALMSRRLQAPSKTKPSREKGKVTVHWVFLDIFFWGMLWFGPIIFFIEIELHHFSLPFLPLKTLPDTLPPTLPCYPSLKSTASLSLSFCIYTNIHAHTYAQICISNLLNPFLLILWFWLHTVICIGQSIIGLNSRRD